jgi:monoterpene epsilon-lactone hydrolase
MKPRKFSASHRTAPAGWGGNTSAMSDDEPTADPRERPPVPHSISEQAQAYLAAPLPYGEPAVILTADAGPEAWLEFIRERDAEFAEVLGQRLAPDLPVERTDIEVADVPVSVLRPHQVRDSADTPIYLDIHGGALVFGGGDVCAVMASASALRRNMITWAIDYRMPPLYPYPAGLDDCLAVYGALLEQRQPADIFVGGVSAGGNLAAALMLRAKDAGLPMPAALVLGTPEVDLTESGDTFRTNDGIDHTLGSLMEVNLLYANGHALDDPYLSPLFGDVTGFPPTLLFCGTRDLFLSNTVRMHRKLRAAGVDAQLHVWEAMPHGGFGGAPEDLEILTEINHFLDSHRR